MSAPPRPGLKGLLARRPALLAWTLELRARRARALRSWRSRPTRSAFLAIAVAFAAALVIAFARDPSARTTIAWLAGQRVVVGIAAALLAVLSITRRRASLTSERESSWLLATPLAHRDLVYVCVLRVAAAATVQWLAITCLVVAVCLVSATDGVGSIVAAMTFGFAIGAIVGAVWPLHRREREREGSRYVPNVHARIDARPSLRGLSRWPIARALAWHRPENSRWLFIVAALSVPMGASAFLGIAILAVWSLGSYLLALTRWLPHVASEAALWLRPTPISLPTFAWALIARVLLHQCIGTALLAAVLMALGASFAAAVYFGCLWMSIVLLSAAVGIHHGYGAHAYVHRGTARARA